MNDLKNVKSELLIAQQTIIKVMNEREQWRNKYDDLMASYEQDVEDLQKQLFKSKGDYLGLEEHVNYLHKIYTSKLNK